MNFENGKVYYVVMYEDEQLRVPIIQTAIFAGTADGDSGKSLYLFDQYDASGGLTRIFFGEVEGFFNLQGLRQHLLELRE